MNIYVGNFSYDLTEDALKTVFEAYGRVESAKIIKDKYSGESRGFGFVEMPDKREAEAAMQGIREIEGKAITINEARPQVKNSFGPRHGGSKKPYGQRRDRGY